MARQEREQSRKHPQPPPIPVSERRRTGRPCTPLIPVDESSLGPAMLALTGAQRAFVVAKVALGLSSTAAAKAAGYSDRSPHALSVHASRLAHQNTIQAAILEEGQKLMRSEGPKSVHVLVEIRDSKTASDKDRMSAAKELLDRSGFHATTEHHVSVEHSLSDAEKDRRMLALAKELGLSQIDAQKLLIAPDDAKDIIDAEYSEVEPAPKPVVISEQRARDNELRRQRRAMNREELAAHKAKKLQEKSERGKARAAQISARLTSSKGIEDLL